MTTTRRQLLDDLAADVGLYVRTWSPGDGVTRYRFFDKPGNSYFGPANGIATCLGVRAAETWLYAYTVGASRAEKSTATITER